MNPSDYVATVRLSNKENETLALPGERCGKVPLESIPFLLVDGYVVLEPIFVAPQAKQKKRKSIEDPGEES